MTCVVEICTQLVNSISNTILIKCVFTANVFQVSACFENIHHCCHSNKRKKKDHLVIHVYKELMREILF